MLAIGYQKYALLSTLAVGLVVSPVQVQSSVRWSTKFQEAVEQLRAGNLTEATRQFETLWSSEPEDFVLANAVGTALDSAGHHREATEWYHRALSVNPQFAPACNNPALNYIALGEMEKALAQLRKANRLDPINYRVIYNLGLVHLQMGHFREASYNFERAHKLKPAERDPVLRLALSRFKSGLQAEGLRAVEELMGLPGNRRESSLLAVRLLNSVGLYHQALDHAHKAQESGWTSGPLLYEKANALFHLAQYKEATEVLSKGSIENNTDLNYYLLLGSAQVLAGNLPSAVKNLQTAVRLAPERPEPYYRLALAFLQGYRDQEAEEVLSTGLKEIPNWPLLLFTLGHG